MLDLFIKHLKVIWVIIRMKLVSCHAFLVFYGSFAVKRRIQLSNSLNGYGGSLLLPSIL
jgi:hypothetical protein